MLVVSFLIFFEIQKELIFHLPEAFLINEN